MSAAPEPSPDLFFKTITAYQDAAALKTALDLQIFTLLAEGPRSAADLAARSHSAARGARILCDHLTVQGFLTKAGDQYSLTPDSAVFLNRNSPAYLGETIDFLQSEGLTNSFNVLTDAVRRGGTAYSEKGTVEENHPIWISFARAMGGMMLPAAQGLAELVALDPDRPAKVLDVAAGHGIWGLAFARNYPQARVVALDWLPVLEVVFEKIGPNPSKRLPASMESHSTWKPSPFPTMATPSPTLPPWPPPTNREKPFTTAKNNAGSAFNTTPTHCPPNAPKRQNENSLLESDIKERRVELNQMEGPGFT